MISVGFLLLGLMLMYFEPGLPRMGQIRFTEAYYVEDFLDGKYL